MSETVHHFGTLTEIRERADVLESFAKSLLESRNAKPKPDYFDTYLDYMVDEYFSEFYLHRPTGQLYEMKDESVDFYEELIEAREEDGVIKYRCIFYNGGAGLNECIEEAINKMNDEKH